MRTQHRRPGERSRRSSGRAPSPYTPASEPSLIDGWDARSAGLTPGTISSWTGVKGTVATLTGTTRIFSLTSIVDDEGGTHPGVQFAAAIMTCPVGGLLVGKTRVAFVAAVQDFIPSSTCVMWETGAVWTATGAVGLGRNITGAGDIDVEATRTGQGRWTAPAATIPADPFALTVVYDFADAQGSTSRRIDNVEILGGTDVSSGVVTGTGFANLDLSFGGRAGGTSTWVGYLQQLWILDDPDEATLTRVARYAAAGVGQVAA